eukprot:GHVO01046534.1.p1 GENE.GHVO01046534.1~~GHVO01046534.1.p1  ORF type:complete len:329 (+),score=43.11 GHVO01046534.1:25-1011(+)
MSRSASVTDQPPVKPFKRFADDFAQQKLRAWQPVLTPKWIIGVFVGFGIVFVAFGILLIHTSHNVQECKLPYSSVPDGGVEIDISYTVDESQCVGPTGTLKAPLLIYYEITGMHQNHRRFVRSRSDEQLKGTVFTDPSDVKDCDPQMVDENGLVLSPCGLAAMSVFNDTYTLQRDGGSSIIVDTAADTIAWGSDLKNKFKNPPDGSTGINEWLDETIFPGKVENGHFINWMRNAALPTFRKLWGRINEDLELPFSVTITNRYPVASFGGTKTVVISSTSWIGGRNDILGILYLTVGCLCVVCGFFFVVRTWRKPRILGDVRFLNIKRN